jgi:hypothetical protein
VAALDSSPWFLWVDYLRPFAETEQPESEPAADTGGSQPLLIGGLSLYPQLCGSGRERAGGGVMKEKTMPERGSRQ